MIESRREQIISLKEAAKLLGKRVSYSTWWRWGQRGIRGHRLRLTRVGGRTAVSVEALEEFLAAINVQPGELPKVPQTRQREAAIRAAERDLDDAGVGGES